MQRRTLLKASLLTSAGLSTGLPMPALGQNMRARTLRLIPPADVAVLDPLATTATISTSHGYNVFDTLYAVDGKMRPQPQMAEGHTVSEDGRAWTIRLREGLMFHDRTPVRSIDCATSIDRWTKGVDTFGQIVGNVVDRYETPDDRTLVIRLKRPFPLLLDALGKADACVPFIMPERIARFDPRRPVNEIIGSGPFRLVREELNSGSLVVYEKFDGYKPRSEAPDWASGAKVAHFERVEWRIITDPSTAQAALTTGEVDWVEAPIADLVPALARDRNIKIDRLNPFGELAIMRLNCLQPPFDNPAIRRAMMMAIRQEDYMQATFGDDRTLWSTCYSLFPQGTPYYSEAGAGKIGSATTSAAVRKAFEEAGYKGEKIVIINPTDNLKIEPLGQVTYDILRRAELNVELQQGDWGTVAARRGNREPTEKGGWSIFHTYGTATIYGTPALSPLVRGLGESGWFGWWKNEEVEALVEQWLYAPEDSARQSIARQLNTLSIDGAATLPLGQVRQRTAYRTSLTGIRQGNAPYPWNVRRS